MEESSDEESSDEEAPAPVVANGKAKNKKVYITLAETVQSENQQTCDA